jgi:ferric-dicitrate binding protein FerR (iron transport regulator)
VDSGGLNSRTALRIDTPAGAVHHVGTQFQVRVDAGYTRLQVREGRVVLAREGAAPLDLGAGDVAEVSATGVRVEHRKPAHGDAWEWAASTAPAFDIENRPLAEFLGWLAREHGWQLRYVDSATQSQVQNIRLHGSMADLDVNGMLERASLITGVALSLEDGFLRVGSPR